MGLAIVPDLNHELVRVAPNRNDPVTVLAIAVVDGLRLGQLSSPLLRAQ
jgi:hypothetical protein